MNTKDNVYWLGADDCMRALRWICKNDTGDLFGTNNLEEIIEDESAKTIITRVREEMDEQSTLNSIKLGDLANIGHGIEIIIIKIDRLSRRVDGFDKYGNYYTVPIEKVQYSHIHYDGVSRFLGGDEE